MIKMVYNMSLAVQDQLLCLYDLGWAGHKIHSLCKMNLFFETGVFTRRQIVVIRRSKENFSLPPLL